MSSDSKAPPKAPLGGSFSSDDRAMVDELNRWWNDGDARLPECIPVIYREAMERLMELVEALASHPDADPHGMARMVLADIKLVRSWMRQA